MTVRKIFVLMLFFGLMLIIFALRKEDKPYTTALSFLALIVSMWSAYFAYLVEPELYGKIISLTQSQKAQVTVDVGLSRKSKTYNGIQYLLKLSINVLNRNYSFNKLKIYVSYPKEKNKFEGKIYWVRDSIFSFPDGKKRLKTELIVPESLSFVSVFEKDKPIFRYISFIVEKENFEDFSEIELRFINQNNKYKSIVIKSDNIDFDNILYEPNIWEEVK